MSDVPQDVREAVAIYLFSLEWSHGWERANETQREAYRERAVAAIAALRAAVPGGWKLVPVEPTDEMLIVALRTTRDDGYGHCHDAVGSAVWRAMLSAAPKPPA